MRKLVGHVGVDSGQVMICDPCYIDSEWKKEEFKGDNKPTENFSYPACCDLTIKSPRFGQLNYKMGHPGVGVVSSSGYGDGLYPVYAEINEHGRIKSLFIEFIDDSEENDWKRRLVGE